MICLFSEKSFSDKLPGKTYRYELELFISSQHYNSRITTQKMILKVFSLFAPSAHGGFVEAIRHEFLVFAPLV